MAAFAGSPSRLWSRLWILCAALCLTSTTGCEDPVGTVEPPPSPPVDDEFDAGSGIADQTPTAIQIQNLALLGKVWGFTKYHHRVVVGGYRNWDYDLFRAIPSVLAASDRDAAASEIVGWLVSLGGNVECIPCLKTPSNPHLLPDIGWIVDTAYVGATLSARLQSIHWSHRPSGTQHYVAFHGTKHPTFPEENSYRGHASPDAGYRLLALFRFWNIIQYWYPYRDVMDEDWDAVLREFIPIVMEPMDGDAYRLAMIKLTARVHDTHANVRFAYRWRPPTGNEYTPFQTRFVDDKLLVTAYTHAVHGPASGLEVGDEIQRIDGIAVATLVDSLKVYYGASNEASLLRIIGTYLMRGIGPVTLGGVGASGAFEVTVPRVPTSDLDLRSAYFHDLPGPAFQMLDADVAYLKLSSVVEANSASYIEQAQGAEVLVIDIRNYPNEPVAQTLGGHLVSTPQPFARLTVADRTNPGAFVWTDPQTLLPNPPRFPGKVVILVDETTISAAEHTTMAFRVAPEAIVVGSNTAGADGTVSRIPLPGGVESQISGIGVFYPDKTPTQRVGIIPDLVVRPTVAGIREGRDEVLEAGVSHALGREFRLSRN